MLALPEDVGLLSLDVFDTALVRDVCQPDHVFCLAQRKLERAGTPVKDFARIRAEAERTARLAARQGQGMADIHLDAIYRQLRSLTHLPQALLAAAKDAEIEAELECVRADPDILVLYQDAIQAGIPVVFLSDMYLPESMLERMLASCGYRGELKVYASGERGLTKTDGGLFRLVLDESGLPSSRMLHIGDNHQADAAAPASLGIRTIRHNRGREAMRKSRPFSHDVLPLSRFKAARWTEAAASGCPAATLEFLGRTYGAVIHGAFTRFIVETALAGGAELLLFFSRDGYVLKKAYDIFRQRHGGLPPSAYCCVSRLTLRTAGMDGPSEADLDFLLSGLQPKTAGHILKRCGVSLTDAALDALLASCALASGDLIVERGENNAKARKVLTALDVPLRAAAARQRAALDGYLHRFGLDRFKRIAVIDLGWAGSLQRGFEQAASRLGFTGRTLGLYFGLRHKASEYRALGHEMAAFLPDLCSVYQRPSLLDVVPLLELLHGAPHGGVTGYDFRDGSFRPLFAKNGIEQQQYEEKLAIYQAAALDSLRERGLMDPAFTAGTCREAIVDLCEHPNAMEAEAFGDLVHFDGFEHDSGGQAIAPAISPGSSPESVRAALDAAYWKTGFIERNRAAFPWLACGSAWAR